MDGPLTLLAVRYSSSELSLWVNGEKVDYFSGNYSLVGIKEIAFDKASLEFKGNVRQVLYFNEALSDAELEYITSADIDLTIHNYKGSLSKISATYEDVGVKDRLTKLF